jgi:hypothetical protein
MPVAGYRITEGGDTRFLENGDTRVTEGFQTANASLSASSGYDFVGEVTINGATTYISSSSLVVVGNIVRYAAIMVANNSTLTALGTRTTQGVTNLSALSTLGVFPSFVFKGANSFNAAGTISSAGRTVKFVFVTSGNTEFTRVLENEDYRITENGNSRITNDLSTNTITSSLVANDTYIPFNSVAYYKTGGIWKVANVDAKYLGNWDALQSVYKKISGNWKRIY